MNKIIRFYEFLIEGGQAIKSSRRIRESEAKKTVESIEEKLLPLLGNPKNNDYIFIGSLGKKKNPDDTSGDIDLGISSNFLEEHLGTSSQYLLDTISEVLRDDLPDSLGVDVVEIKVMKGINVISIGWPIEGDYSNGIVQLDIIPISNMEWAKFIFYSPDYKKDESKYKSAHRNWLFQAILSAALKEPKKYDENGDVLDFDSYAIRLNDGVYKNSKTYRGVTKRLKNPQVVPGQSSFITRDPKKLLEMLFGPGVNEEDVKTFEDAWKIVNSPDYIYSDKLDKIKENLIKYLNNGGFEIPSELT
jgi:hypothetical protein